jgi:hypothetical protein
MRDHLVGRRVCGVGGARSADASRAGVVPVSLLVKWSMNLLYVDGARDADACVASNVERRVSRVSMTDVYALSSWLPASAAHGLVSLGRRLGGTRSLIAGTSGADNFDAAATDARRAPNATCEPLLAHRIFAFPTDYFGVVRYGGMRLRVRTLFDAMDAAAAADKYLSGGGLPDGDDQIAVTQRTSFCSHSRRSSPFARRARRANSSTHRSKPCLAGPTPYSHLETDKPAARRAERGCANAFTGTSRAGASSPASLFSSCYSSSSYSPQRRSSASWSKPSPGCWRSSACAQPLLV